MDLRVGHQKQLTAVLFGLFDLRCGKLCATMQAMQDTLPQARQ